jgi:hypothetical protein
MLSRPVLSLSFLTLLVLASCGNASQSSVAVVSVKEWSVKENWRSHAETKGSPGAMPMIPTVNWGVLLRNSGADTAIDVKISVIGANAVGAKFVIEQVIPSVPPGDSVWGADGDLNVSSCGFDDIQVSIAQPTSFKAFTPTPSISEKWEGAIRWWLQRCQRRPRLGFGSRAFFGVVRSSQRRRVGGTQTRFG